MDWLDLLAVQGTLKSFLQHHSSKPSILQHSAFFTDQLSHPFMTTGKTIALTSWTLVGKVMSLLLNMLSRLVITFLPRSSEVAQSCPTLCDPTDYSLPASSIHGIFQARVLEWVAITFSMETLWGLLKKRKVELPCDPASPLPGRHPNETKSVYQRDICTPCSFHLFKIAKI